METFAQGVQTHQIRWTKNRMVHGDPRNDASLWLPYGFFYQSMVFTVPLDIPEDRVQFNAAKYRNTAGKLLEREGLVVLALEGPTLHSGYVRNAIVDPDRKLYIIWAKVTRKKPIHMRVDVPDEDVPMYETAGFKLES
jgi:hypothetical protein